MCEKIHVLEGNHIWDLVDLPDGKSPAGRKWVFTVKVNSDGSVTRFKAKIMVNGYAYTI